MIQILDKFTYLFILRGKEERNQEVLNLYEIKMENWCVCDLHGDRGCCGVGGL